jgi:hypothetical protein
MTAHDELIDRVAGLLEEPPESASRTSPCSHLQRLTGVAPLRPLVNEAACADILTSGGRPRG